MRAWLMASALHYGNVNLVSGWWGFWDTSSHFHVGVFLILPLFLDHVSTRSRASKPPEPENTEEHTAAELWGWERWPFANYVALCLSHTHLFYLKPFPLFCSCAKTVLSVIKCYSIILDYESIFGLVEWIGGWYVFVVMLIYNHGVIIQWICPCICINIKRKIAKHHL